MSHSNIRLGLCCIFREEPIAFRSATATQVMKLGMKERRQRLAQICLHNARALLAALAWCRDNAVGCFRINSQILPVKTHPAAGYELAGLPGGDEIIDTFRACGTFCRRYGLRTTFHPDQFIVLSSPDPAIVRRAAEELVYQAGVARLVGSDVINLHAGGGYGDKPAALARLVKNIRSLPGSVRSRLTLENDDRVYTPAELLPVCRQTRLPLVYDVHHHRVLPDSLTIAAATAKALATWGGREPLFHLSSPRAGWQGADRRQHHDFIDPADVPACWLSLRRPVTIEVEAKAKEIAVMKLREMLLREHRSRE